MNNNTENKNKIYDFYLTKIKEYGGTSEYGKNLKIKCVTEEAKKIGINLLKYIDINKKQLPDYICPTTSGGINFIWEDINKNIDFKIMIRPSGVFSYKQVTKIVSEKTIYNFDAFLNILSNVDT